MATEAQTCAIGILTNRPNAQESDRPSPKPPISPNSPTIYNLFMQKKPILKQKFTRRRRDSKIMAKDKPNVFYNCRESSTNQAYFLQNKANFRKSQMNITPYNTKDYENKFNWTLGENKPNSNPIKPNLPEGKIDTKCVFTKDYEEKCG